MADNCRRLNDKPFIGICLKLLGLALYPLSDAFLKHFIEIYSVPQATFLRALARILPLLTLVFFQGGFRYVLFPRQVGMHLFRLVINISSTFCFMYAFSYTSLTTVYTFGYSAPLFMLILSAMLLKERINLQKTAMVCFGLLLVLLGLRPGSGVLEIGALLVLTASFLAALNKVLMRRLAATEHSLAIAIYPNIVILLMISPFLFVLGHWQPLPLSHWAIFALIGAITAAAQYSISQALRYTQASILAPADYSSFFWVVLIDFFWWNKPLDVYTIISMTLIVSSFLFLLFTQLETPRVNAKDS